MIMMIIPLIVGVLYYWMFFFLWMNMICCTLKHLPCSSERQFKWKKGNPHPQTSSITHFCFGYYLHHLYPWISQTWLGNLNMIFMQTYFTFHDDLLYSPAVCVDSAHRWYTPCWFLSAIITSFSDCLLSQQDLVSDNFTDVVDKSCSDS